mmetsp:Transcript_15677/g.42093  ORF Transcript_15677/g.42093 Transcript_15677/m.42093 type:complete len:210 (-) Transcript_15677:478-1107(-)
MSAMERSTMATERTSADTLEVAVSWSLVQSEVSREISSPDLAASKKAASCDRMAAKSCPRRRATTRSPAELKRKARTRVRKAPATRMPTSSSVLPLSASPSPSTTELTSSPKYLGTRRLARLPPRRQTRPTLRPGHSGLARARMREALAVSPPPGGAPAGAEASAEVFPASPPRPPPGSTAFSRRFASRLAPPRQPRARRRSAERSALA